VKCVDGIEPWGGFRGDLSVHAEHAAVNTALPRQFRESIVNGKTSEVRNIALSMILELRFGLGNAGKERVCSYTG
jgi:hypothetical protein